MSDRVTINIENNIADVRFNRPDKMNALDKDQIAAIAAAGEELSAAKDVRAIVLSGNGPAFCAGLDMSLFQPGQEPVTRNLTERTHGDANIFQHIVLQWRHLDAPVIAAIHGPCIGGGLQFASAADIRVVGPDTKMSIMEMRWGLIPDMGSFATWRNFVRDDVLRELTYTNRIFGADEAKELGFVSHLSDDPHAKAMELATEIAGKNPDAIKASKRLINKLPDMDEAAILMMESEEQQAVGGSPNQMEAVMAFMQKRPANFVD